MKQGSGEVLGTVTNILPTYVSMVPIKKHQICNRVFRSWADKLKFRKHDVSDLINIFRKIKVYFSVRKASRFYPLIQISLSYLKIKYFKTL